MVELKCKQKRTSAFQMESGSLFSKYPGIYGLIFLEMSRMREWVHLE